MRKNKKTGIKISGDPRKRAAANSAEREKQLQSRFNKVLDEFLSSELAEKSEELAETFINSRNEAFTPDETDSVKRFFHTLTLCAHTMQLTGTEGSVNFKRIAADAGISVDLCKEIEDWMREKGLIRVG